MKKHHPSPSIQKWGVFFLSLPRITAGLRKPKEKKRIFVVRVEWHQTMAQGHPNTIESHINLFNCIWGAVKLNYFFFLFFFFYGTEISYKLASKFFYTNHI
jgi:hypothetical protein